MATVTGVNEGSASELLADVLTGKTPNKETATVRLPHDLMSEMREEADQRGLSFAIVIEERCRNRVVKLAPGVLKDARPWTAISYRLSKALQLIGEGKSGAEILSTLQDARKIVVEQLLAFREPFDSDMDKQEVQQGDNWSGRR